MGSLAALAAVKANIVSDLENFSREFFRETQRGWVVRVSEYYRLEYEENRNGFEITENVNFPTNGGKSKPFVSGFSYQNSNSGIDIDFTSNGYISEIPQEAGRFWLDVVNVPDISNNGQYDHYDLDFKFHAGKKGVSGSVTIDEEIVMDNGAASYTGSGSLDFNLESQQPSVTLIVDLKAGNQFKGYPQSFDQTQIGPIAVSVEVNVPNMPQCKTYFKYETKLMANNPCIINWDFDYKMTSNILKAEGNNGVRGSLNGNVQFKVMMRGEKERRSRNNLSYFPAGIPKADFYTVYW